MKKILLVFALFNILTFSVCAKSVKNDFESVIQDSGVDLESIAISIKNADNGKKIYSLNEKILMNPASVQKVLTTPVAVETLGNDYEFSTELYKRDENSYLIKLGADPYLTTSELKNLVKQMDKETSKIYLDDFVLDSKTWGEGWQWDDDMNILMPRFGSYNLDKNLIKLTVVPTKAGQFATIINPSKYPLVFFNNVVTSDKTNIDIKRDSAISPNTLMLTGSVSRPTVLYIPTVNLKRYFDVQLTKSLEERSIYLKDSFVSTRKATTDELVQKNTHSIDLAVNDILKNSNNMVSETIFKLAGGKYCNLVSGTDSSGIKMFNDYCSKNNLDNSRIRISDASGVSKNNLVSADFITEFLKLNKDNEVLAKLPKPGEGTLTHRLVPIKNNLRAKTGTLKDISSIAGYLTTKTGKNLVFCIMINDMKLSGSDKKMLEDFILREAYLRL